MSIEPRLASTRLRLFSAILAGAAFPALAACPPDTFADLADFSHADSVVAQSEDRFAEAIATNGQFMAAGLSQQAHSTTEAGEVYLYRRGAAPNQWQYLKRIDEPGFSEVGDNFGGALAMDGDTLVVGAIQAGDVPSNDAGAVHVFERNLGGTDAWGPRQSIIAQESAGYVSFGVSVALDRNRLLVGDRDADSGTGKVVIYERSGVGANFTEVKSLVSPPTDVDRDHFGDYVAVYGDTVIVSDPLYDVDPVSSGLEGRVYVYDRNQGGPGQWGLVTRIDAPAGITAFGSAISLWKDRLAIASLGGAGRVHLHERNQGGSGAWGPVAEVDAGGDSISGGEFGKAIHLHENELLVGASAVAGITGATGAAYVFQRDAGGTGNWGRTQKLFSGSNNNRSNFGASLDYDQGFAVIGDPLSDHPSFAPGSRIGRAYVYLDDLIFCTPFE